MPVDLRELLIDQAATWDLLDWQRPSDDAALWGRLCAERGKDGTGWNSSAYHPDPT